MTGIKTIMKTELITVEPSAPVKDAVALMAEHDCGAVMVRQGDELVGIFSERDLLTRVVAAGLDPASTEVGQVSTREVSTVEADAELDDCFELIRKGSFRHLPIVDDKGKPIGMVSARDFYRTLATRMEAFIDIGAMAAQVKGLSQLFDEDIVALGGRG